MKNDRLLRALCCEPVDMTPVWMMRQAGRYLPEYRATRSKAGSFMDLCRNPDLACEVTIQPLDRFPLDAAILFSDILTVPDAMGLGLYFTEGEGPHFERPVRDEAAVDGLAVPDLEAEFLKQKTEGITGQNVWLTEVMKDGTWLGQWPLPMLVLVGQLMTWGFIKQLMAGITGNRF